MRPVASSGANIEAESPVLWALNRAERVLPYFEEKYPDDDRPRKAVDAARAWVRGEMSLSDVRAAAFGAHAAARDAAGGSARAAARAAGHAAATAHVISHAPHAAAYGDFAGRERGRERWKTVKA